jgi:hypothetical protein
MWNIFQLERHLADGLVITVHWEATKNVEGASARVYGSVGLPPKEPTDPSFVPFDELTPEIVIAWVQAQLGEDEVASIESSLDAQIEAQLHPVNASGLPW